MRILVIEDDEHIAFFLKQCLQSAGFVVDSCETSQDSLLMLDYTNYNAIVLDLGLPDQDGLSLLKTIRNLKNDTPILILTGQKSMESRLRSLNSGADDYMTKPFDKEEMVARIQALIRRSKQRASAVIKIGDLIINQNTHEVLLEGIEIDLTRLEYMLLLFLALHQGEVVTRIQLSDSMYEEEIDVRSNIIDVLINHLRKKIKKINNREFIFTIRGSGYILDDRQADELKGHNTP